MKLIYAFIDSLKLPKKEAMKRVNKLNMKTTIIYLFFLLIIWALPIIIELLALKDNNDIPRDIYIIQVLIVYPFLMVFLALVTITIVSFFGTLVSKAVKRKLKFQLLWKMSVFALTLPTLVYTLMYIIIGSNSFVNGGVLILFAFTLVRMILHYPKQIPTR